MAGLPVTAVTAVCQLLQNAAAPMLLWGNTMGSNTLILNELHWLPVPKLSEIAHKTRNGLGNKYLKIGHIIQSQPTHVLRSADEIWLVVHLVNIIWGHMRQVLLGGGALVIELPPCGNHCYLHLYASRLINTHLIQ